MATVHVSNIAHTTSEKEVKDFFSFCGKITDISITPTSSDPSSTLSATVTFERESAAKTALLLDNTQLGASAVHVESSSNLDDLSKSSAEDTHHDEELRQEDKPRTTILAEYLSHGYVIGDKALQRGIDLDNQHGITSKFTSYLSNLDNRFKATDKARAVDNTYGVQNRAMTGYNTITRYFESALNTPTGQKVRDFYTKGQKQVMDIHSEARRLADIRKQEGSGSGEGKSTEPVPAGDGKTKCQCAGNEGVCKCAPGACACAGCQK